MNNDKLDELVKNGTLLKYDFNTKEEEPGSGMRETEELILYFPNGEVLVLGTFCSGVAENSGFMFD